MNSIKVWVGFVDGKPHHEGASDQSNYFVCSTRKAARVFYEDVREMTLVPVRKSKARALPGKSRGIQVCG